MTKKSSTVQQFGNSELLARIEQLESRVAKLNNCMEGLPHVSILHSELFEKVTLLTGRIVALENALKYGLNELREVVKAQQGHIAKLENDMEGAQEWLADHEGRIAKLEEHTDALDDTTALAEELEDRINAVVQQVINLSL